MIDMAQKLICSMCGHAGAPKTAMKGNIVLEAVLWLLFIVPGLIYSIWRSTSRHSTCRVCGSDKLIPIESPVGQKLLADQGKTVEQVHADEVAIQKNRTIGETVLIIFAVFFGVSVFFGIIAAITSAPAKNNPEQAAPAEATFDIPALVGLNLIGLEAELGKPDVDTEPTEQQIALGTKTWEKTWNKGKYFLMATYDVENRNVVDLFLGARTDGAFVMFKDTNNILAAGNLKTDSLVYSVEFVKAVNGSGYTGAIVREK